MILKEVYNLFELQPYLRALYAALFSTAYFGLFRIGELTKGDYLVRAQDVHLATNKKKLLFVLRTSKTHWKNVKPQIIKINSRDTEIITNPRKNDRVKRHHNFCPYLILKEYAGQRKSFKTSEEPFFVFKDRTPITPVNFRGTVKSCINRVGFNADHYCSHGFRMGRSLDLFEMGLSVETIKKLRRWKSYVVYRYLK